MGELARDRRPTRAPASPCHVPPRANPPEPANALRGSAMPEQHACLLLSRAAPVLPHAFDFCVAHDGEHGSHRPA